MGVEGGGRPIGILQHLRRSLVFREPSVDQEDKKKKVAPEPRRHSTGKQAAPFPLTCKSTHTYSKILAFLAHSLFFVPPSQEGR